MRTGGEGMDSAKVVQVIKTNSTRGDGTSADPKREVVQYWDFDGNLIGSHDPINANNCYSHCDSNGPCDESDMSITDPSTKN